MLTPSLVGMAIFVMGPILGSLALSFTSWDMFADIEWVGFANYFKAIGDPAVRTALGNTMLFILGYLPPVVGIGLGLAIARELVERQGGAIWLERTSDSGTTFSLTLPAAPSAADSTTDGVADETTGATADVAAPADTDAVAQAA